MDVTGYEVLLFLHILFVVVWVGGDVMIQAFALRALSAGPERTVQFARDVEWVGNRVLVPASLAVVIFGVWLVLDQEAWEFSQFWISAGLAMFLISFVTGAFFLGPRSGRIAALANERGPEDPEVQRLISRNVLVSRIELVLLVLIVADMVVKPGL
jgi:uncharacterized membrane protein